MKSDSFVLFQWPFMERKHTTHFDERQTFSKELLWQKTLMLRWQLPQKKSFTAAWIPLFLSLLKSSTLIPAISPANPAFANPVLQSSWCCSWHRDIHKFYECTRWAIFLSCLRECHARQCHTLNKFKTYLICCLLFIHLAGCSDKEWN